MLLKVSALQPLDELKVPQKCLLPDNVFVHSLPATTTPGTWAKCYLSSDLSTYALCQIFARDFSTDYGHCFASTDVVAGPQQQQDEELQLHHLECIAEEDILPGTSITQCDCELLVNERIFDRRCDPSALCGVVQAYLQQLTLAPGCRVRMQELQAIGIEAVAVVQAISSDLSPLAANKIFAIADTTRINIINTKLASPLQRMPLDVNAKARQALQAFLHTGFERFNRAGGWFASNALIVGPSGVGKSSMVADVLRRKGCNCFCIQVTDVLGQYPGETEAALRRIFENARQFTQKLKPKDLTVLYFDDLHLLCPRDGENSATANDVPRRVCSQLLHLLDELQQQRLRIVCVAATSQPENVNEHLRRPGRFDYEIALEPPNADERCAMFAAMLAPRWPNDTELTQLIGKYTQGYVLADMLQLVQHYKSRLTNLDDNAGVDVYGEVLRQCLRKCKPLAGRSADVRVLRPTRGFQTIGGMDQLKRILQVAILAGLQQTEAFQRFGLTLPKGLLLYGPPGCAKTTIAKCLAAEANMSFIATSGAEVYSPYVGCAERFLANIFNTARKNAPCLIFLDEIDALIGRRSLDARGSSDVQLRILSTLLTEMDGVIGVGGRSAASGQHIVVVAATNRPDMVDDALLRPGRFDRLIHVPVPDVASRTAILQLHAQRMPLAGDVVLSEVAAATHHYSGADLCNLCNEAAMQAFQRDFAATEITRRDFEVVLQATRSSLTASQIDWYYEFERKFAA